MAETTAANTATTAASVVTWAPSISLLETRKAEVRVVEDQRVWEVANGGSKIGERADKARPQLVADRIGEDGFEHEAFATAHERASKCVCQCHGAGGVEIEFEREDIRGCKRRSGLK